MDEVALELREKHPRCRTIRRFTDADGNRIYDCPDCQFQVVVSPDDTRTETDTDAICRNLGCFV